MPVGKCESDGSPGYRWGESGTCYTYTSGDEDSKKRAKEKAEAQGRAAYASGYKMNKQQDWMGKPLYEKLPDAEKALADSLLSISEQYGPLDSEESGIWIGYVGPEENEDKGIGVKCSNCALHVSQNACAIISQEIHPDGNCRLAVIPPGYVNAGMSKWAGSFLPIV